MKRYYGYYKSPIGILEIIASEDAVLSVMFVDGKAEKENANPILAKAIVQLDEYFTGRRKKFDIDISLEGTSFQQKVWSELMNIPYGEAISYRELADRIGNEKAARCVGNANARNKLSIIVPCHRVIGSDGKLTGYAGGLDRKQWLLKHERNEK